MEKNKMYLRIIIIFSILFLSLPIFSIEIVYGDDFSPQTGDYSLTTNVSLENLTIFSTEESSLNLSIFYKKSQVLSGSSVEALRISTERILMDQFSYNERYKVEKNEFSSNIPESILFLPFTERGFNKISLIQRLTYYIPGISLAKIDGMTSSKFNDQDFKAHGLNDYKKAKFAAANLLSAEKRYYVNLSRLNKNLDFNPKYVYAADQFGLRTSSVIRTEDLIGETNLEKQQYTYFSGYKNFEKEAIIDVIKDYTIDFVYRNSSVLLSRNDIEVSYEKMTNIETEQFFSDSFMKYLLAPIDDTINEEDQDSPFGVIKQSSTIRFLGISFAKNIQSVQRLEFLDFPLPNINIGSILNSATDLAKTIVDIPGKIVNTVTNPNTWKTVADTTGAIVNAALNNPITESIGNGVNAVIDLGKGLVEGGADLAGKAVDAVNPKNLFGGIVGMIADVFSPLLPIILIGVSVLALIFIGPPLLSALAGRMVTKKVIK